ncbi:sugar ABC transporter ATP-binding protein [Pseudonocardia sp. EC080610-09]|uniref:ABC transporter ATP-binding protein n=1 Tax=unclassified Pseudonocardia TaxID=2619320 RepID=UPI0006CB7357|nr:MULTISPECIES: ABC transporter ATP-binding protein [unclassified Pseudonocardia]ALE74488.1 sugar ABC transporter ATP-binding protein [Pseudonocardia sp. EC080625-04]ALL77912.1 sugar ABC transporter ATP-binding protein [Pseudonocardia sp. EC080610-09]ALL80825.1 sugar ABC transporter ATP-binding protein [Pseudonocardia sp. EC080619-01]
MADVVFDQASRIYTPGSKPAVDRLDLTIEDGEFVVLVGPSGSGKSTALRMLAGLEDIDGGSIRIDGENMVGVPSRDRDIAMVFQNYALYPNKSVGENMAFPLKMAGVEKSARAKKVKEAAEILGLTDYLDRRPKALSGGQRQRVAMGRAIVREPRVFLMDEPLSNLDAKMRVSTRTEIASLQRRLGVTTVYVTHDQVEAMTMGDRVALLADGKLQQFATPADLYDRPQNAFVAGFIGSPAMNLFTVPVTERGVTLAGHEVALPQDVRSTIGAQQLTRVTVGIRPEQWTVSSNGHEGIPARVDVVEELGSDAFLYGVLAESSGDLSDTASLTGPSEGTVVVRTGGRSGARRGDRVTLTPSSEGLHLFHPESGDRL